MHLLKLKNKWKTVAVIVFMGILFGSYWLGNGQKKIEEKEPIVVNNYVTTVPQEKVEGMPFVLQKANEIIWRISDIEGWESEMPLYNAKTLDTKLLMPKWAKELKLEAKTTSAGGDFIYYQSEDGAKTLYEDNTAKTIKFQKDLLNKMVATAPKLGTEVLRKKLTDFWQSGVENNLSLIITRISYETVGGPRFLASNESEASIVTMEGSWQIGNYLVNGINGNPVIAKFSRDGEMVYLSSFFPLEIGAEKNVVAKIMDKTAIMTLPASQFVVAAVYGNATYDSSPQNEIVAKTTITKAYVGYMWNPYEKSLLPYVFGEGNAALSTGPATVVLAAPISK